MLFFPTFKGNTNIVCL